ncbi:Glycosyltransferase involved in cell wall bisynthesis [Pelosinus fermentans]|uniref:glycosyltransferase n=1 Tax=Pelosinus fermentans TaxID=365349 RepID=UPI0002685C1A|nr:glycosyltransferase [Pelosinus fermentans]OAM92768.1 glycosyl transferase group 1 [Pelosinus fermentans DSM 17108]SDQ56236.1 Glycosyltransferase involved in cell wall bisynthesis [Pelosinus fermentans]
MPQKTVLNIVSGAPSGALNIAIIVSDYFSGFYNSRVIFRKYNKTSIKNANVVKDVFIFDYIFNLCKKIDEIKPELILVHGYSTHLWTKIAAAIKKVPLIHIEHNTEKYTWFRRWLLQKLDKYTQVYICVSKGVANHLIAQGADPQKVRVIYNGIDIEKFQVEKQLQTQFTIGMTARFSKQKDQLTLIKAVEFLIFKKKLPIKLVLQGDGKQKAKCEEYVHRKKIEKYVHFETGKLVELLPRLNLFVLSTFYEGLPLVVFEAMAAKVQVIASRVPGVDEIIEHGHDGYLVSPNKYMDLSETIEECYHQQQEDEQSYNNMINNAYQKVNRLFSVEIMCEQYYSVSKEFIR